jgi:Glycosyltransferase family 87
MTGGLLLAGALLAVALTGWAVVSCLPGLGPISAVLGAALVGYAELVLVPVVLSPFGALGRTGVLAGLAVCLAAALSVWLALGRPHGSIAPGIRVARAALHDPALAALGALVAVGGVYLLVLALATPELDWDPNAYHLPRAVFWLQQGGIGEIRGAADVRLSWAPPGAEIATAVTMAVAGTDRYIGLPQLLAWPVAALAVAGIARRLGLEPRAALFAGLAFACLPVVLLQAPSGFNDLVVAAALLAAFHLVLGRSRTETALAAAGIALALTTKLTALIALPVFLVLAILLRPAGWRRVLAACAAGGAAGSAWYVLTLVRTGSIDGGWAETFDQTPDRSPVETLVRVQRYMLDFFDLSGFAGGDVAWLPIAAALLLVLAGVSYVTRRGRWAAFVGGAVVVASLPWLVQEGRWVAVRAFAHTLRLVGAGDRLSQLAVDPPVVASPFGSWYGPVFLLLWCVGLVLCAVALVRRRRDVHARAWPLLVAPLVFAAAFAVATIDDGARGRFFVFPVGLCAAGFAIAFDMRVVRLALPPAVAATMLVCIVHSEPRPLGIELFAPVRAPEVWGLNRFQGLDAMSAMFGDPTRWTALPSVTVDPSLAVAAAGEYPLYALFGVQNRRRLVLVGDPSQVPPGLDLLLVTPHARKPRCGEPWRPLPAAGQHWYALYARADPPPCPNA